VIQDHRDGDERMAEQRDVPQEELLLRMGIKKDEWDDYKTKFSSFFASLNDEEKKFHIRNNERTAEEIAKSLGEDVTVKDIERLFKGVPHFEIMFPINCCRHHKK
jgi:hypothetical protein